MKTKTYLLTFLSVIGISLIAFPFVASAQSDAKQAEKTAKVKAAIQKLGTGNRAVAKVKLYSKTEYKGYISRAGDQDFELVDAVGAPHVVNYSEVKSIGGKNLSTGAKIGIGIGIGAAATILTLLLIFASLDD